MREVLTALTIYVLVLATHSISHSWQKHKAERARREADAETLDAISPLYQPMPHSPTMWGKCRRHVVAGVMALSMHPATVETAKHYTMHFFIYSGIILPNH